MSASPPPHPSPHTTAHAYASNGLEILQAASDAAQAIQNSEALQHAAAQAVGQPGVAHLGPGVEMPSPHMVSGQTAMMRDPTINPKLTRLRRACDMCSMRKVKCDDSNIPCRPCRELNVDCTYNRETKRRGPPNKHAEAAKAAKKSRVETRLPGFAASPSPQIAAKTLLTISSDAVLDAESIAPMPVLELLVDDFFTYIHPLAPFPHEPTFRQSFANREDRTRPEFLALLSSMIGALVASFPRCVRDYLKSQHNTHIFPKAVVMVDKCRDIALHTRGARWPIKQPKTLDDAMTSYFLGLGAAYTVHYNVARIFLSETLTLIRELGFTRPKHQGELPNFGHETYANEPLPFNHVKDQIGKRIFWCLLLGNRTLFQLTSHNDMVIAPSTPNLPYPQYPENTDDICIQPNEIMHQTDGSVTLLTGFRFAIDIYTTMNGIVSLELAYGMSTLPWADQRILLRDGLMAAKSIIDNLPPELQLGSSSAEANPLASLDESGMQYVPPVWPNVQPSHDLRNVIKAHPVRRRQLQYEIQKANIFVSQLATRSYFVELYFDLRDIHLTDHPDAAEDQAEDSKALVHDSDDGPAGDDKEIYELMSTERELIVQNLLMVLGCISQRNLEPNGRSLVEKIRQVASTLLNDAPHRKGPLAVKSEAALEQLINILVKLERTGPVGGSEAGSNGTDHNYMTAEDEEAELLHWEDLREYQLRFAAAGGFNGEL
ncbi:Putative Zn(II)2Cys6 transcription factor [Beauveria bassiana ARSEF 2860]|uniref:Putative Zn(II)2Cys6 transcription factor n=1 Tax=Beauveria bassiana (strain ARSEF 2860) TaxID=655819 RepID=J4UX86_BEAB2|nr:Putative Zn(II)2Cys6 transcription factor [Beauveria bassiana ARSEF 2860]EJP71047.1 Putative Zn(II)2Cys6 transcription factor [Beauveria bassiana ARSEF 2860]